MISQHVIFCRSHSTGLIGDVVNSVSPTSGKFKKFFKFQNTFKRISKSSKNEPLSSLIAKAFQFDIFLCCPCFSWLSLIFVRPSKYNLITPFPTIRLIAVIKVGGSGHKVMLLIEGQAHAYVFPSPGKKSQISPIQNNKLLIPL